MDFSHPWSLLPAVIFGMVGMVFFFQGKKNVNLPLLGIGIVMCVFPYIITGFAIQCLLGVMCLVGGFKAMRSELA